MLDDGWRSREGANNRKPLGIERPLPESDGMVFQCVPGGLEEVALGRFDAAIYLTPLKALDTPDQGGDGALNRFLESGVLSRANANISKFYDHGNLQACAEFGAMVQIMRQTVGIRLERSAFHRGDYQLAQRRAGVFQLDKGRDDF